MGIFLLKGRRSGIAEKKNQLGCRTAIRLNEFCGSICCSDKLKTFVYALQPFFFLCGLPRNEFYFKQPVMAKNSHACTVF